MLAEEQIVAKTISLTLTPFVYGVLAVINEHIVGEGHTIGPTLIPLFEVNDPRWVAAFRVAHRAADVNRVIVNLRIRHMARNAKHIARVVLTDVVPHDSPIVEAGWPPI